MQFQSASCRCHHQHCPRRSYAAAKASCNHAAQQPAHLGTKRHNLCSAHSQTASMPAAAASRPVLVQDGVVLPAPESAQALLTQHRNWSYTSALVQQHYQVVDWPLHLQRLIRNMEVLGKQRPPAYAAFLSLLEQQGCVRGASEVLAAAVNPSATLALQALAAASSQEGAQGGQAMLVVLVMDRCQDSSVNAGSPTQESKEPPVPLSVLVWAKAVVHQSSPSPGKVLVAGRPRSVAAAKHCDWVVARQPLEQLKQQAAADEVVLADSSGALLEGLTTNFFIIADKAQLNTAPFQDQQQHCELSSPQPATAVSGSRRLLDPSALSGLVVLTAGLSDAVLLGVTQQRVLQACQQLGLPVLLAPVRPEGRPAWREAFITNCIKGIQPIQQIQLASGQLWDAPECEHPITSAIRQVMLELQDTSDLQQV